MYEMLAEVASEFPQHLTLFIFGVAGWSIARITGQHFTKRRLAVDKLASWQTDEIVPDSTPPVSTVETPSLEDTPLASMPVMHTMDETSTKVAQVQPARRRRKKQQKPDVSAQVGARSASTASEETQQEAVKRSMTVEEPEPEQLPLGPTTPPRCCEDPHEAAVSATSAELPEEQSVAAEVAGQNVSENQQGGEAAVVNDRVARLLAKKAARKAQKALERTQQLFGSRDNVVKGDKDCADARQRVLLEQPAPPAPSAETPSSTSGQEQQPNAEEQVELEEAASAGKTTPQSEDANSRPEEPQEWAPRCGIAWADEEHDGIALVEPPREPPALLERPACEGSIAWTTRFGERSGWTCDRAYSGAFGNMTAPVAPVYQAVITDDGRQFYTDGDQVFVLAGVELAPGALNGDAALPEMRFVVDPGDEAHQVIMNANCATVEHTGQWSDMIYNKTNAVHNVEDAMWDVCWA